MGTIATAVAAGLFVAALAAAASALGRSAPTASVDAKVVRQVATDGRATFWVVLREQADLGPARSMRSTPRGRYVYEALTTTADRAQSPVKAFLRQHRVPFTSFWILNAIRVTGDATVLEALADLPEVDKIIPDVTFKISKTTRGRVESQDTVEWGVDRINAPRVWSTFNDRGENIVVGNIDTGVLYTHGALVAKYRGNLGGGNFDHDYDWWDPSAVCGSAAPCDNNGHGTHTMGTMVGDDGDPGTNQVGVAPHAKWIAAKGCESSNCSTTALLNSGQWVLAPTDLNGQNPRADLRPNIVNNPWGNNNGADTFYQATVQAWVASGIFPAFANGNAGPACGTVGAPGSYPESYGVGAYDINNTIASFSSRGPAPAAVGGQTKPDISAPGVNVRSSWNDGAYNTISGTSMATPHLAGTVALI